MYTLYLLAWTISTAYVRNTSYICTWSSSFRSCIRVTIKRVINNIDPIIFNLGTNYYTNCNFLPGILGSKINFENSVNSGTNTVGIGKSTILFLQNICLFNSMYYREKSAGFWKSPVDKMVFKIIMLLKTLKNNYIKICLYTFSNSQTAFNKFVFFFNKKKLLVLENFKEFSRAL